jgi:chitodextrinase
MYLTHYPGDGSDAPTCNCTDGDSSSGEAGCAGEVGRGQNKTLYSYLSHASSPEGPWSAMEQLLPNKDDTGQVDQNLAPMILKVGSRVRIARVHSHLPLALRSRRFTVLQDGSLKAWTRWDIWESADWKDASQYVPSVRSVK